MGVNDKWERQQPKFTTFPFHVGEFTQSVVVNSPLVTSVVPAFGHSKPYRGPSEWPMRTFNTKDPRSPGEKANEVPLKLTASPVKH